MNAMELTRAIRMLTAQTHKGPTTVPAALDTKEMGCHAEVRTKDSLVECFYYSHSVKLSTTIVVHLWANNSMTGFFYQQLSTELLAHN